MSADNRVYQVKDSTITIQFGDIRTSTAEVIVSSDDASLSMGAGVSAAIRDAAGPSIRDEARKLVPARVGDVLVTSAGALPSRYVLHAITLGSNESELPPDLIVRQATLKVMGLLPWLGCTSVAFPSIGTGVAGISPQVAASQMAEVLVSALFNSPDIFHVEIYLLDLYSTHGSTEFFMFFERSLGEHLGVQTSPAGDAYRIDTQSPSAERSSIEHLSDRRSQIFQLIRYLDLRRDQLEAELLEVLRQGASADELVRLRSALAEVQTLRRGYEQELRPRQGAVQGPVPESVFISSTAVDLRPHREALRDVLARLRLTFIGMEDFAPTAVAPAELIRTRVTDAEVYLGVLGMRYGSIDPASGLSMTELEYRQAVASDKERLMFVLADDAPITANMVERDPAGFAKLVAFKQHVLQSHVCSLFNDVPDLVRKAEQVLRERGAKSGP